MLMMYVNTNFEHQFLTLLVQNPFFNIASESSILEKEQGNISREGGRQGTSPP
jgi:hypothetical protein